MNQKFICINDIERKRTVYINPMHIVYIDRESQQPNTLIHLSDGSIIITQDDLESDLGIKF